MHADDQIRHDALAWAVQTGDPAFAEWDDFIAWLEADPAHLAAYEAVAAAVTDAADALAAVPEPANDDGAEPAWWWHSWKRGIVPAALAVAALAGVWSVSGNQQLYETAPGETELVELADGSTITLAGGSRVELTGDRAARLLQGQALFTVVHNEADPFVLLAGNDRLVDAGTVFDVKLGAEGLVLGVSEGAVVFNPQGQDVRVDAGNQLVSVAGAAVELGAIDPSQVGEWRAGRLTFDLASLDVVAQDLTRATGIAFTVARASGQRHTVSGSLLIAPVENDPRVLEDLLDVRVRRTGEGWELAER